MRYLTLALMLCCCVANVSANDDHEQAASLQLSFNQPENFTDFQTANGGRNSGRTVLMAELERYLRERTELWLPPEHHLEIVFQDIDMAGRIVPLPLRANVGGQDIGAFGSAPEQRLVSNPFPPRLELDYHLRNAHGEVIRQGRAEISEASFLNLAPRTRLNRRDSLWYEKAILDSWMRELTQN